MHTPAPSTPTGVSFTHEQLARAVATAALLRGTFTLRSGRTSSYYLDKYRLTTRPDLLAPIAELLCERVSELGRAAGRLDRLAGAELGGVPIVTAVSLRLGLPTVLVRNAKKDYGTARRLEGVLEPGDRVVLLEDVATTAGQALEAVAALREAGAEVEGIIAVVDRLEGARENVAAAGLRFSALFTSADLGIAPEPGA